MAFVRNCDLVTELVTMVDKLLQKGYIYVYNLKYLLTYMPQQLNPGLRIDKRAASL